MIFKIGAARGRDFLLDLQVFGIEDTSRRFFFPRYRNEKKQSHQRK